MRGPGQRKGSSGLCGGRLPWDGQCCLEHILDDHRVHLKGPGRGETVYWVGAQTMAQRTRLRVRGKINIMNFVPYFSLHAICSLSSVQKGNCIILSLQSVEFDLRSWGGIELDQGQYPESGPGQVRSPNHSANLAARVDGGVPVQADQLGQPRLNQHLPFDNRGKPWKSWRQDPCNFHPTKPRLLLCQQRSHKDQANYFTLLPAPTVDKWTKLRLSEELQNEKIKLKFFNNDEEMLSVDNSKAVGLENVKVYASDP